MLKEQRDLKRVISALIRQQAIGPILRELFTDTVEEPLPKDFLGILGEIDKKQSGRTTGNTSQSRH